MGLRQDWKFQYHAEKVYLAARKKADYHFQHFEEWSGKLEEIEDYILEKKGIKITPQMVTGGRRLHVDVETSIQDQWSEAMNKKEKHERLYQEYERWCRALADSGAVLELDADDIEFFGL